MLPHKLFSPASRRGLPSFFRTAGCCLAGPLRAGNEVALIHQGSGWRVRRLHHRSPYACHACMRFRRTEAWVRRSRRVHRTSVPREAPTCTVCGWRGTASGRVAAANFARDRQAWRFCRWRQVLLRGWIAPTGLRARPAYQAPTACLRSCRADAAGCTHNCKKVLQLGFECVTRGPGSW